jgi:hypothetical protein
MKVVEIPRWMLYKGVRYSPGVHQVKDSLAEGLEKNAERLRRIDAEKNGEELPEEEEVVEELSDEDKEALEIEAARKSFRKLSRERAVSVAEQHGIDPAGKTKDEIFDLLQEKNSA